MYFLVIFAIFIASASAGGNVPPFCKICSCENGPNNNFDVKCTTDVRQFLYDKTYWVDQENNQTYSYNSIKVQNSPILSLDKPFLPSDLKLLNLANNSIVNISDYIFAKLQNMETLVLSYNNIELLHPDAFKGVYVEGDYMPLKALRRLHLDYNRIHSLDGDVFEHTTRVEILTLSHNPIKILDQQTTIAITSLVQLKQLDLSYTGLATLPDNFLHTPKYLLFLDLSGNNFERVPQTLGDAHSLATLYMNDNPIVNLTSENGFPKVSTLKSLHMNSMRNLQNVSAGALSNLENLEELYLFNNIELFHVDKAALSARRDGAAYPTWPPIQKLYLQNNKLTSLDMALVLNWRTLTAMDLTNNPWTCECENQWMIDELMPIYLALDEDKAKSLRCAAPIEMESYSFFDVYQKQSSMRCLDLYGHRPERDGTLLVGILAGVLITIPLILFIVYSYQRHWFGIFDGSPASYSRQFYKRSLNNDEYL